MGRRAKRKKYSATLATAAATLAATLVGFVSVDGAIVAPPWADAAFNPCATQAGGWQLIYWPPDKKCYRIFSKGYPCPETMELAPGPDKGTPPQCSCPPGSAQSATDSRCYPLYEKEPCDDGEYFGPLPAAATKTDVGRFASCQKAERCALESHLFWPKDGKCYPKNQRGPCPEGLLLTPTNGRNPFIGKCGCDQQTELAAYYYPLTGTCHEFYTAAACAERGQLFLPGAVCGCAAHLPQYHNATGTCYQLGGVGPCASGHEFIVVGSRTSAADGEKRQQRAECVCKEGHVRWFGDGACYRPYTRGPCSAGNLYSVNVTSTGMAVGCIPLPCAAGKLYFPTGNGCHKIGTRGPCPDGQVVLFQDSVKTSVEGISYLGMCGCPTASSDPSSFYPTLRKVDHDGVLQCGSATLRTVEAINPLPSSSQLHYESSDKQQTVAERENCANKRGIIAWSDGTCQQLYTQGPCNSGEWVVPDRSKGQRKGRGWKTGKCECRPGYTVLADEEGNSAMCQLPAVFVARVFNNSSHRTTE